MGLNPIWRSLYKNGKFGYQDKCKQRENVTWTGQIWDDSSRSQGTLGIASTRN